MASLLRPEVTRPMRSYVGRLVVGAVISILGAAVMALASSAAAVH
jgi:hypothetical protein